VLLLSFAFVNSANAQEKITITHGPYLVDPAEDAITVIWFTSKPATSWIEYAEYTESGTFPTWGGYPETAKASHAGLIDANTGRHIIRIKNLKPGTKYKYRINSKEVLQFKPYEVVYGETVVGDFQTFNTLNPEPFTFSFAAISDIHEDESIIYKINEIQPLQQHDLIFLNGDILNWIGDEKRIFDGFLDASVATFAKEKPFIMVRGNHETRGPGARWIMDYFPHESGRNYYAFTHGDVRFVVLDCGEDKADDHPVYGGVVDFDAYRSEQATWFAKESASMAYKMAGYRVVVFHIPAFSVSDWHGATDITNKWGPILNRSRVDLIINGHTHRFERIMPIAMKNNAPILITGKGMVLETQVSAEQLSCKVVDMKGKLVDEFSLPKQSHSNAENWRLGTSVGNIMKLDAQQMSDLAKHGFTDIEVGFGRLKTKDDIKSLSKKIREVKKMADQEKINIWSIHIPYGRDIDISLIDEKAREKAIEEVKTMMKLATGLKPEKLVIHPSFEPILDEGRAERLEACISSLPGLLKYAEKLDMHLCIEDLPRTCLGNTSWEINQITAQVPGLGVCCDVNHLLQESTEAFIDAVGSQIVTLHICDYDGIDERHWLPGKGIINWNAVIQSLELNGFDGPFMFESAGTLAEKAAVWEQLKTDYQAFKELK